MNEQIFEAIVGTVTPEGQAHWAPMGVRYQETGVVLMPFRPSRTLDHILAQSCATLNLTTDVRVFAACICHQVTTWAHAPAHRIAGFYLTQSHRHLELTLREVHDDGQRPRLRFEVLHEAEHRPFRGFNRAQAAVLEAAVLVSRLHLLPIEKILQEWAYLQIAIDKTAGPDERRAWAWLNEAVQQHRQGLSCAS